MRIIKSLFLISGIIVCQALALAIEDAAAKLQPHTFGTIKNDLGSGMFHGGPTMDIIWAYASRTHWDPATQQLMFVGSAHGTGSKFIVYDAKTDHWRNELTCREPQLENGSNRFGHAYDMRAFDTDKGAYWVNTYNPGPAGHQIFRWYPATNTWDSILVTGTWDASNTNSIAYFPPLKKIVSLSGSDGMVRIMDPDSLVWRLVGSGGVAGGYEQVLCYNPKYKILVFGGGDGGGIYPLRTLDTNLQIRQLTLPSVTIGSTRTAELVCDPGSGDIVLFTGQHVQAFSFTDSTWSNIAMSPAVLVNFGITGSSMIMGTIPELNVHVILNTSSYNVLLYKHSAGGGIAVEETPPILPDTVLSAEPNPFNPAVTLYCSGLTGKSSLAIYNSEGRLMRTFPLSADQHSARIIWDGLTQQGSSCASGLYVARLVSATRNYSIRLLKMQ